MANEPDPESTEHVEQQGGSVIRLVTIPERDAELEQEMHNISTEEALDMLRRAEALIRERGCKGLALAFVLGDDCYATMIPKFNTNTPTLIGAVATMQQMLILASLED